METFGLYKYYECGIALAFTNVFIWELKVKFYITIEFQEKSQQIDI